MHGFWLIQSSIASASDLMFDVALFAGWTPSLISIGGLTLNQFSARCSNGWVEHRIQLIVDSNPANHDDQVGGRGAFGEGDAMGALSIC